MPPRAWAMASRFRRNHPKIAVSSASLSSLPGNLRRSRLDLRMRIRDIRDPECPATICARLCLPAVWPMVGARPTGGVSGRAPGACATGVGAPRFFGPIGLTLAAKRYGPRIAPKVSRPRLRKLVAPIFRSCAHRTIAGTEIALAVPRRASPAPIEASVLGRPRDAQDDFRRGTRTRVREYGGPVGSTEGNGLPLSEAGKTPDEEIDGGRSGVVVVGDERSRLRPRNAGIRRPHTRQSCDERNTCRSFRSSTAEE